MKKRLRPAATTAVLLLTVALTCATRQPAIGQSAKPVVTVTARITARTLQQTLDELSQKTGVLHKASAEVGDLKVTVLVHDLPLDDLRARLADVLHLTWKEENAGDGQKVSYSIYRSARNIAEEAELEGRGERAFRRGIQDAIAAAALPKDQRDKFLEKHPDLARTFTSAGGEAGVNLIGQIQSDMLGSIMDGNNLEISPSAPPPGAGAGVDQLMKQMKAANSGTALGDLFALDGKLSVTRTGEGANSELGIWFSVKSERLTGSVGVSVRGTDSGEAYPELYPDHKGAGYIDARARVSIPEELSADSLDELLAKVAGALNINIVCESYRQYFQTAPGSNAPAYPIKVPAGATTIENVLDSVVWVNRWWKHDSVYIVQRPMWWIDRRGEITDAALAHIKNVLSVHPLSLEAMGDVGRTLDEYQWGVLVGISQTDESYLAPWQYLLRFYGNLSPALKRYISGGDGISATSLNEADSRRLASWIHQRRAGSWPKLPSLPENVRVKADRRTDATGRHTVLLRAVRVADDGSTTTLYEQSIPDPTADKPNLIPLH